MNEQPRTRLGTISIWLALAPLLALVAWFAINPPCGSFLRSSLDAIIFWGTIVSFPFSIVATFRDKPRKRALIGLSLSSLPLICFLALVVALVSAVATGSTGIPGTIDILYSDTTGTAISEPGVHISTDTKYYDISGSNEEELRAQVAGLGPEGYAALTHASYSSYYDFREHDNVCEIDHVRVDTKITFTYPRWKDISSDQKLADGWNRNLAALENHEKGHEEIARKASQDMYDYLYLLLPAYPSCGELKQKADALEQAVLEEAKKNDREYDRVTDHGRNQATRDP